MFVCVLCLAMFSVSCATRDEALFLTVVKSSVYDDVPTAFELEKNNSDAIVDRAAYNVRFSVSGKILEFDDIEYSYTKESTSSTTGEVTAASVTIDDVSYASFQAEFVEASSDTKATYKVTTVSTASDAITKPSKGTIITLTVDVDNLTIVNADSSAIKVSK